MSGRRTGMLRILAVGIGAAALAAVASGKPWAVPSARGEATLPGAGGATGSSLTSAGEAPLALALALVALAGWGAVLVTRGWFRRAVALTGTAASLGLVVVAVAEFEAAPRSVRHAVADVAGAAAGPDVVTRSGWYWGALVAAVVLSVCYLAALRGMPDWPSMGSRYDAPGGHPVPDHEPTTNLEMWRAIDNGDDPTGGGRT